MTVRLWYPQLDAYDAVRRMVGLLAHWSKEHPSLERLYICDFFLANPPLLHRTNMPRETRNEFSALGIEKPEHAFLSYPSAPVLFQKMAEVQKQALRTLVGKGLTDLVEWESGRVALSKEGWSVFRPHINILIREDEVPIISFLSRKFARIGQNDMAEFHRRTGLRRSIR